MHNLDLSTYTLSDLRILFDLETCSVDELKRAKKKVLAMHPDKSSLPPEYFLFYKKAFEVLVYVYGEPERMQEETTSVKKNIDKMPAGEFHREFNRLFDAHMKVAPTDRNQWFSEESVSSASVQTPAQMAGVFETLKANQIVPFREVAPVVHRHGSGLYDDEEEYITTDPFAKLKFDDLRKVHKDQTIFPMQKEIPRCTLEEHQRRQEYTPLDRTQSTNFLDEKERLRQDFLREKQYASELQVLESQEKNKTILSRFLHLDNR